MARQATSTDPSVRTVAIVAPSPVPLRFGGAERHWDALAAAFRNQGAAVDVIKVPVREYRLDDLLEGYEAFADLDLSHVDLVVSGKYPAWMVQHPRHVVWMLHPLRGLYDTWLPAAFEDRKLPGGRAFAELADALDEGPENVPPDRLIALVRTAGESVGQGAFDPTGPLSLPGPLARSVIHHLDRWALDPARIEKHLAISGVVADREGYFPPGMNVEVVHPPPALDHPPDHPSAPDRDSADPEQGRPALRNPKQLVSVCRLDHPKRVDLVVRAFAAVEDPDATLEIVGDGPQKQALENLASKDARVHFSGFLTDSGVASVLAKSVAAVVAPADEDFGYAAVEAMQQGTPVITTKDSGGPTEIVTDSLDGIVTEPTVAGLAAAMSRLLDSPLDAGEMGREAARTAGRMNWTAAVDAILRMPRLPLSDRSRKIVAVSTFPVSGAPGGGPARGEHLLRGLSDGGWEVVVVCFDVEGVAKPPALATGYRQVVVEPSERHRTAEAQLRRLTGNVSISDIAASLLWRSTPEFSRALARELYDASAVICEQPYLAVAVAETDGEVPMILDAHNHEVTLKEQVLPNDEAGRWMLDKVTEVERIAAKRSVLVAASTEADLSPLQAMVANASKQPASMQTSVAPTQPGRATGRSGDLPQRWIVVPNGVDTSAIRFVTGDERAFQTRSVLAKLNAANFDHLVLFVGSAHAPNIAAGRWLAANAHLMPDSFVVLAGAHSDSVDTGGANNVRTLGTVGPDVLESLLSGASVAVNPMSGGSGSNLKLVEYFAAGAPVVSTPKGARGIDDPTAVAVLAPLASFVPALKETLAKPQSGKVLAARDLVESDFNWATLAQRFATSVTAALGPAASGAGLGNPRDGDPTSTSARP